MTTDDEPQCSIDEHKDYCDLLDYVKKYADMTKKELVDMLYDESGDGETKAVLHSYSKGELVMRAVDDMYGGNSY